MGNGGFCIQRPLGHDPDFFGHRRLTLTEHSQRSSINQFAAIYRPIACSQPPCTWRTRRGLFA